MKGKIFIICILCGAIIVLVLGGTFFFVVNDDVIQLRYDQTNVEYDMDGDVITRVSIEGRFPYRNVYGETLETETSLGSDDNMTEVYVINGEPSFFLGATLNFNIEISENITRTYILKFEDRDIIISNGKVVEQEP